MTMTKRQMLQAARGKQVIAHLIHSPLTMIARGTLRVRVWGSDTNPEFPGEYHLYTGPVVLSPDRTRIVAGFSDRNVSDYHMREGVLHLWVR